MPTTKAYVSVVSVTLPDVTASQLVWSEAVLDKGLPATRWCFLAFEEGYTKLPSVPISTDFALSYSVMLFRCFRPGQLDELILGLSP